MTSTTPTIQSASLHYREGNSDKVYHAAIEPRDNGYAVTFAYGRRGSTLNTGTKNPTPVPLEQARRLFDKLVGSKHAKGYRHTGGSGTPTQQPYRQSESGAEGRDTGIRCQLLNPVEQDEIGRLIISPRFCLQEKHDGRRLLVRKQGDTITGINRRGLTVAIPDPIRQAVALIPGDVLIDGEAVGETLHAFDLLESDTGSLRELSYLDRFRALMGIVPPRQPGLRWIATPIDPDGKLETFEELRQTGAEGVVFKDIHARYSPGRPNTGGPQLKFKFVESASFVVTGHNARRSVTLGLYDGESGAQGHGHGPEGELVAAGNVTIPANHEVPAIGQVIEVRYLYAFRQSGSIYQPVYQGPRTDIPASECGTEQLKYKAEPLTSVA